MNIDSVNLDTWYCNRMLVDQIPAHFTPGRTYANKENMEWLLEKLHGRFSIISRVNDNPDDFMSYYQKTYAFEDPKEAVQFELTWS